VFEKKWFVGKAILAAKLGFRNGFATAQKLLLRNVHGISSWIKTFQVLKT